VEFNGCRELGQRLATRKETLKPLRQRKGCGA
jgi:hypothetical protein